MIFRREQYDQMHCPGTGRNNLAVNYPVGLSRERPQRPGAKRRFGLRRSHSRISCKSHIGLITLRAIKIWPNHPQMHDESGYPKVTQAKAIKKTAAQTNTRSTPASTTTALWSPGNGPGATA